MSKKTMSKVAHRMRTLNTNIALVLIFLTGTGLVTYYSSTVIWDGAFPQAEYRLRFATPAGNPIEGIRLDVIDKDGKQSFGFPVSDYYHDSNILSDSNGVMVFHHVTRGLEYGGRCSHLYFFIPLGTCEPPLYRCRFLWRGHEVSAIQYNALANLGYQDHLPITQMHWKSSPESRLEIKDIDENLSFKIVNMNETISVEK